MSLNKNKSVRCDRCGKLSRDPQGYYKKPDGTAGYINSRGYNIAEDFCDECAEAIGEKALYDLEHPDRHAAPEPPK